MLSTRFVLFLFCALCAHCLYAQQKTGFNDNWEFVKAADSVFSPALLSKTGPVSWQKISLPHTANIEPVKQTGQQWQGICFYRKFFSVPTSDNGKHIAIRFDAAMQEADVYLNGTHIFNHKGGYLPFYIDISGQIQAGVENSIVVKLDNRDNPLIPPGKPLRNLDFNYYSGIYRNAWLIVSDRLYISDPVAANAKAGGGVFVHYQDVSEQGATLVAQTEVRNDYTDQRNVQVRAVLKDGSGRVVAQALSQALPVAAGAAKTVTQQLAVTHPRLWTPENPYLYQLSIELVQNGRAACREVVRTGIRSIRFDGGTFYLNGKAVKIRGTNRHQEYPCLGNAASDNAQYRDVWKMKQAGFNFVRSSHYPQSPAYLSACDELGLMVMDAIPGWQFAGTTAAFQQQSYQDARDMIRRDRNHPSIILWEASLNESGMKKDYMEKAHQIVHEELPFERIYSAGWIDDVYDVFLPARQHAKAPDYWKKYSKNKPFIIAEYGDWEYYAQNAGFNQTAYKDLKPEERTSRQLRTAGEKGLFQQALNFQEAHNDNGYAPAVGDANWLMFDYNRGYAADIESSGIMDIMRLPKFAFYFYQSQLEPVIKSTLSFNKPMLFIANYWQPGSDSVVRVYSNCEEVELFLNGRPLGRKQPDKDQYSTNLVHPPFTFHPGAFIPGTLTAVGYIGNKSAAQQTRSTPGRPAATRLRVDYSGKGLQSGQNDVVFVYADITDANGALVNADSSQVAFTVSGDAEIVGPATVAAEAGIATVVLKAGARAGPITVMARAVGLKGSSVTLQNH